MKRSFKATDLNSDFGVTPFKSIVIRSLLKVSGDDLASAVKIQTKNGTKELSFFSFCMIFRLLCVILVTIKELVTVYVYTMNMNHEL